jgi:AcrR family transcriptional regulator
MELLDAQLSSASSADDVIDLLRVALEDFVRDAPELIAVTFEFAALARRNEEIAGEFAELLRRIRDHVAALLSAKEAEGVLHLHGEPEAIADVLFSLADGISMRMLVEAERDWSSTVETAIVAVRALLTDR